MDISPERLIEELCELVAKEKDYTELKRLIGQLIQCLDARQKEREQAKANSPPEERSP